MNIYNKQKKILGLTFVSLSFLIGEGFCQEIDFCESLIKEKVARYNKRASNEEEKFLEPSKYKPKLYKIDQELLEKTSHNLSALEQELLAPNSKLSLSSFQSSKDQLLFKDRDSWIFPEFIPNEADAWAKILRE